MIDHLGMANLPAVLRLVERGAYVKASGFGRIELDVPQTLRAIAAVNPAALLFGTDLPGTRARRPFADADLESRARGRRRARAGRERASALRRRLTVGDDPDVDVRAARAGSA